MIYTITHLLQHNEYEWLKHINLTKTHPDDAGWDIRLPFDLEIPPQTNRNVSTGLHVCIPPGFVGLIKSRSSLAIKEDLECSNAGVIDSGFHGEIIIKLYNHHPSRVAKLIKLQRVAQLLVIPCMTKLIPTNIEFAMTVLETSIAEWPETARGQSGIGSTGKI